MRFFLCLFRALPRPIFLATLCPKREKAARLFAARLFLYLTEV